MKTKRPIKTYDLPPPLFGTMRASPVGLELQSLLVKIDENYVRGSKLLTRHGLTRKHHKYISTNRKLWRRVNKLKKKLSQ